MSDWDGDEGVWSFVEERGGGGEDGKVKKFIHDIPADKRAIYHDTDFASWMRLGDGFNLTCN